MAIAYIVKINNQTLPAIKGFKVSREKLYTDANRNMAGELKATLVGTFPKIFLEFTHTTAEEMELLIGLLDQQSFNVAYWDAKTRSIKTGVYYAGQYDIPLFMKSNELYAPFNVNLIPFTRE